MTIDPAGITLREDQVESTPAVLVPTPSTIPACEPLPEECIARTTGKINAEYTRIERPISSQDHLERPAGAQGNPPGYFQHITAPTTVIGRPETEDLRDQPLQLKIESTRGALTAGPSRTSSTSSPSPSTAVSGAGAVAPARPSAITVVGTTSRRFTPSQTQRERSRSPHTTDLRAGPSQRAFELEGTLWVTDAGVAATVESTAQQHCEPRVLPAPASPFQTTTSTIAAPKRDEGISNAVLSGGPITSAAPPSGIWGKLYSGLLFARNKKATNPNEHHSTTSANTQYSSRATDPLRNSIGSPNYGSITPFVNGVSKPTIREGSSSVTSPSQGTAATEVDVGCSRSSSIGSIHGLLSSAYEYIVSVSRSVSVAGAPLTITNESAPNNNNTTSPSSPEFAEPSNSDSSSRRSRDQPNPSPPPTTPTVKRSFSLSSRLHAAYQAILVPSSTSLPPDLLTQTRQHLIQSEIYPNIQRPASRTGRRPSEDLDAVLNGQQRSGATVHRRNTLNASPAKGGNSSSSTSNSNSASRRDQTRYGSDYLREREYTTSPPPLPIPNPSTSSRYGGDAAVYYRQQQHQQMISRSTTPAAQSTSNAMSSGTPTRRNTIDSAAASFSSFYTSTATSVASSSTRDRERDYRPSKERLEPRERPSSRNDHRLHRSMTPASDMYSQVNSNNTTFSSTLSSSTVDPQVALRLEDRCRHLEKAAKDLQSRLRSKEQELKMKENELRSRELELKAKDAQVRQRDNDVRERDGEIRRREGELRNREEELREVEGILRDVEGEVRRRDEELERYKSREQHLHRELERQKQQTETELRHRKSMKELVDHTKGHVEKLENELKRRATASRLNTTNGNGQQHGRHNSLDVENHRTLAAPDNANGKISSSAPSTVHLTEGYAASKQQSDAAYSDSGSSVSSSSTTRTGHSNHVSPATSPSPTPGLQQRRQPSIRQLAIPKAKQSVPPPRLPYTEELAQQRSNDEFLTRTDSWSGAQVLQAVNDINSEVVQFAAVLTEMGRFAPREVPSPSPSPNPYSTRSTVGTNASPAGEPNPLLSTKSYTDTSARLGAALTHLLATYDHSNDPILVQLALQACVTIASKRAWESFCLGLPAKSDGVLSVIYRSVRESEPQPTSSKWRSLTHGHIHAIYPTLAAYSANELAETMLRWTLDILILAGCARVEPLVSTPTAVATPVGQDTLAGYGLSLNGQTPAASLRSQQTASLILPRLRHITTALTRLENVLRQDILSTSFDLVIPECGMAFGKEWMIDFFGFTSDLQDGSPSPSAGTPKKVLGSVEVGLMCRTRVGMRSGAPLAPNGGTAGSILGGNGTSMSQQQQGGGTGALYEERLLLKPKVILETVVDLL